ncbi:histamine H2 receptor-like [Actinia tenebrosa]|uniref:Histamine H2 receptor-like n=1 Tax=Actinia tenebrosa TaxID=6105 RepID=A0A6P8H812_ACTTE|nr:histamine H2 receptor-like [Actinia tenebrosa]XP_031551634.1 histamine H2 receptor-like [Actinia tenebrosa]XP_031551635.1 histamine H2 receptor-like [Actinia tenebrosa]XP_031551636.1 histamine H2 receptor-like [Actinia tenebrosa]
MAYDMFYKGYFLTPNLTMAIIYIIFGIYTVVGNILVCCVFIKDPGRNLRRTSNYFVVNLSLADILVGIAVEPINAASYWTNNNEILFVYYVFACLSCICSILNICALMVDRYVAVRYPFQYRTIVSGPRVKLALVIIWILSIHFGVLPILGWRSESFQVYLYALGVLTPTLVMLVTYYGLTRILKKQVENLKNISDTKESAFTRRGVEREKRISTTVFIMLMVFLTAWFPFVIVDFLLVFGSTSQDPDVRLARDITLSLGFFSSGINPVLYAWRIPNFRRGLLILLRLNKVRKIRVGHHLNSSVLHTNYSINSVNQN